MSTAHDQLTPAGRLLALWDHLGLRAAHVATQMPADIAGFVVDHPDRVAGIVLMVPTRLDPTPFKLVTPRVLMVAGEHGLTAETTARAATRLPGATRTLLTDYDAPGWADVVADRTDEISKNVTRFLDVVARNTAEAFAPTVAAREGTHAGITWRIAGSGPALVLLPFFLAPSQWGPAMPALTAKFSVITLGGPHIGGVAALEDRARAPTYQAMFRTLIDIMAPRPGEPILDVGCGAGSLDRALAKRLGAANPLTAMDTNPFLLGEAASLARADGVGKSIAFVPGNAESLPFDDASFGCVFSVTVLEECDADRALAEMVRVAKPGGRVGVIVRSLDVRQWWNLDLPDALRAKVETPPQSVAATGVGDASLYPRMQAAGLADLVCFPTLITLDNPAGPIWRYREDHVLSQLTPAEVPVWRAARDKAAAEGLLFQSHVMHCAVGTKAG